MKRTQFVLPYRQCVLLFFGLCLTSLSAFAQFGGSIGGMGAGKRSGSYDRGRSEASRAAANDNLIVSANNSDQLLMRLGTLQFDLKLAEDQVPAWLKFESKMHTYIEDLEREKIKTVPIMPGESVGVATISGMSYVAKMVDAARNRYADLEDIESSVKGLYQVMTPSQRMIVDARIMTILVKEIGR